MVTSPSVKRLAAASTLAFTVALVSGLVVLANDHEDSSFVVEHTFSGSFLGPVWFEVTRVDGDSGPLDIRLDWGSWSNSITVPASDTPALYWLLKRNQIPGADPPLVLTIDRPVAQVVFGENSIPTDALVVPDTWVRADGTLG